MTLLQNALELAAKNYPVFPVNGKVPLIKEWPEQATTEPAQVEAYWQESPRANIGLVTGFRSSVMVLDVDGMTGKTSLENLVSTHGNLPDTLTATTGRGWHLYFKYPTHQTIMNDVGKKLGHGIDVRGQGGFVVAPPSKHANGNRYAWLNPDYPIADPPDWLVGLLTQQPEKLIKSDPLPFIPSIASTKVERYVKAALSQAYGTVSACPQGKRNATLNAEAYSIGQLVGAGVLSYAEAESVLLDASQACDLPLREAEATIKSGLNAGMKAPRNLSHLSEDEPPMPPKPPSPSTRKKSAPSPEPEKGTGLAIHSISAAELMNREFPTPRWAIPNLLPEGLTILAGRPKSGKSWLAFDLCLAVARGGTAMGNQQAKQGQALYMALEDSERRLQDRLLQLIQEGEAPGDLLFTTEAPRYDQGGIQALTEWLDQHPDCRLVVLDTLGRFRPSGKGHGDSYNEETFLLGCLQRLALDRGIALIVIHHTRKANPEAQGGDPLDAVLGSTGLTGVADSIWILKRPRTESVGQLFMTSRDVGEQEQVIEFDPVSCTWHLQMEAQHQGRSIERQKILDYLQRELEPKGPKEVAGSTGLPYDSVRHLMRHMEAEGSITRKARGKYQAVATHTHSQHSQKPELAS